MHRSCKNIQPELLNLSTGIRLFFTSFFLLMVIVNHNTIAQCPEKDSFKVRVNLSNSLNSISIENRIGLSEYDFVLIDVNKGIIDLDSEGIRLNKSNNVIEFRNLKNGEYIIEVSSEGCKIFLAEDNKGTGFTVNNGDR